MTSTNKNSVAGRAKRSNVSAMKLTEAMNQCQKNFSKAMKDDNLDLAKTWRKYEEQLEIIAIVLGVVKI